MPDILERLEKFSVYSVTEQQEVIDYSMSEIRNNRNTMELMGREIERLETSVGGNVVKDMLPEIKPIKETPDDPIPDNPVLSSPVTILEEGTEPTATAIDDGGNVVRDMSEEEIARVFGATQTFEEPTEEEYTKLKKEAEDRVNVLIAEADLNDRPLEEGGSDGVSTGERETLYGVGNRSSIIPSTQAQGDTASDSDAEPGQVGEPVGGGIVGEPGDNEEGVGQP
tara:strand:+ start:13 stop:687 length:675 start_codon:yes stop_codon:yes gene_type:complete